jgi:hypothetical protein
MFVAQSQPEAGSLSQTPVANRLKLKNFAKRFHSLIPLKGASDSNPQKATHSEANQVTVPVQTLPVTASWTELVAVSCRLESAAGCHYRELYEKMKSQP